MSTKAPGPYVVRMWVLLSWPTFTLLPSSGAWVGCLWGEVKFMSYLLIHTFEDGSTLLRLFIVLKRSVSVSGLRSVSLLPYSQ